MSTRCTISHSPAYHLYAECFENDFVHLQLDEIECDVAVTRPLASGSTLASVTVHIPVAVWRAIVSGWSESEWAKDATMDGRKVEFDFEGLEALAEKRVAKINKPKD
jgi:hypothetical protein